MALGLLLSFFVYSNSTPAQAAELTEQQKQAVISLIASFGANEETVSNVTAALNGQAASVGSSASGGQTNKPPIGYAGNIRGGIAHGWTLDPDEPTAKIGFHVYIDGPVGKGGTYVAGGRAGQNRQDITPDKESYGHWYEFVITDQYRDGKDHTLYVYGIDSKLIKGNNTLLKNNPKPFNIARGSIPPLFLPGDRVKTRANLNARAMPSIKGDIVGAEPKGSLGTIVAGPTNAGGYTWWQIDYDNNISWWSADTYLVEVSTPPSEDPSCTITATPASITAGNSSTLSWTSTNATSGAIDNGAGAMTPIAGGTKTVSPTTSTLYTATVTGAGGQATCEASVDVTTGGSPYLDLITDPTFQTAIQATGRELGSGILTNILRPFGGILSPEWRLQQLFGKYPFETSAKPVTLSPGIVEFKNTGKRMVFGPGKRFVLGINSADRDWNRGSTILKSNIILGKYYEPGFELGYAPFRFSDLSSLDFSLTARINKLVDPAGGEDPNPNKNFSYNRIYFYIEKIEPEWIESPARRKFFYFIIPIYDKKYTIHPGIIKTDPLTGRLEYISAQSTFTGTKSFNDMQWITIKKDLLPLIANAIQEAYARGYVDSNDLADYTISRVQLSQLEVSHPIDIEIEYKDYYLKAVYKDTGSDITPPIVSLTAPAGGATVSGNVTISANASDNVGVTGVQFKVDGTNVGAEDTTAPYSIPWDSTTVTNGSHNIRAVARDAAGNTRWSAMRSVTVGNNTAVITSKKGGALANSRMQGHSYTATNILNALNISWYYNWREGGKIHANGVFVPMVWRQDTIDEAEVIYQSSSKKFPVLLAFNEPNNPGMASRDPPQVLLTPAEAASYWDRLTAISTRISAPAPSDGPNGGADGSWLDAFMKLTADKGKRVDFVTLHWYGAPDATKFLNDVD